jgi:hypothetical protein
LLSRSIIALAGATALLAGCAAAPRTPAANLSQAGIKASNAFATDVRTLSTQLAYVNAADAFSTTYLWCTTRPTCTPRTPDPEVAAQRLQLANTIAARATALDALSAAYSALGQEAAANGSADLEGAARRLVTGVNGYVASVSKLTGNPIASAVSAPVGEVVAGIAAEIGERRQRQRLLAGSRAIAASVQTLRNGLSAESSVFDSMSGYVVEHRTAARLAMIQAGLVSRSPTLNAFAQNMGVTPVPGADGILAGSKAIQAALDATAQANAQADMIAMQQRYSASLEALDALLAAHRELEQTRSVSLAGVERVVARLETIVEAANADPGSPDDGSGSNQPHQ